MPEYEVPVEKEKEKGKEKVKVKSKAKEIVVSWEIVGNGKMKAAVPVGTVVALGMTLLSREIAKELRGTKTNLLVHLKQRQNLVVRNPSEVLPPLVLKINLFALPGTKANSPKGINAITIIFRPARSGERGIVEKEIIVLGFTESGKIM